MLEQCFPVFLTKWHRQKIRIAYSVLVKVEKGSSWPLSPRVSESACPGEQRGKGPGQSLL